MTDKTKVAISPVTVEDIYLIWGMFLDREPNEVEVSDQLSSGKSADFLLKEVRQSREARFNEKLKATVNLVTAQKDGVAADGGCILPRSDDIIILQSADNKRYARMLDASSRYNKAYCETHGLSYLEFRGTKRGTYPHHAAFNRIYIIDSLIRDGYTGWVVYVDADAIIRSPRMDLAAKLSSLRSAGKSFWLHLVFGKGSPQYNWWDINDGCFALDLSCPTARHFVKTWRMIYDTIYSTADYEKASRWGEIIRDQASFQLILRLFDIEERCALEKMQDEYFAQFLRKDSTGLSPDQELQERIDMIVKLGSQHYG